MFVLVLTLSPFAAFKTPPFRLEEKGWGEFDLNINLHVAERGGEHKLTHDLNFQKTRYEVIHTLNFPTNKPALLRLLAESGPVPEKKGAVAGAMDSIDGAQQMHAVGSATAGVADLSLAAGGAPGTPLGGGNPHKRKQDDGTLAAAAAAAAAGNGSATAKFKKKAKIEKGSVDLERLADGLRQLGEDDLLGVVEMVTDNLTKEMYIKNDVTEGEFHMDLYTLPDPLLRSLWEYVKKRVAV